MRIHERLSASLYNEYGGRKKPGYMSVVVNLTEGLIYPVPLNQEHDAFVSKRILEVPLRELREESEMAEKIIPSIIEIDEINREILGVLTGVSSLEMGSGVRHSKEDLEKAHAMVLEFVEKGDFPKSGDFTQKIQYKYAYK